MRAVEAGKFSSGRSSESPGLRHGALTHFAQKFIVSSAVALSDELLPVAALETSESRFSGWVAPR
jgi:hypothetical protein